MPFFSGSQIIPNNTTTKNQSQGGLFGVPWLANPYARGTPTTTAASGSLGAYNVSPDPTVGQGAYGLVPGTISVPPSRWTQTIGAAPGLADTSQLTGNILSELQGDINPQALKNMQDAAARYGVTSGMPGSNAIPGTLAFNKNLQNIGLDTRAVERQGQQDYLSAVTGIGSQQLDPALVAEIAQANAVLRSAPDPQTAAQRLQNDYLRALRASRGPAGGTGQYGQPLPPVTPPPTAPTVGGTPSWGTPPGTDTSGGYLGAPGGSMEDQFWLSLGADPSWLNGPSGGAGDLGQTPGYDQTDYFGGQNSLDSLLGLDPNFSDPSFYAGYNG